MASRITAMIVDRQAVFVDDRDVIEMDAHVARPLPLDELLHHGRQALGLELDPLGPRHFDQAEGVLVDESLDHGLHHRQVGDVEGRDGDAGFEGVLHGKLG